jgi:hypothetical protein
MAKKRKQNPDTGQDEEFEEDDEHGTHAHETGERPDPIRGKVTDPIRGALGGDDHEKSEREKNLLKEEAMLRRQRELDQKEREAASEEYQNKIAEAEEKATKEAEERGEEKGEPPPECEHFENYGEFFVPQDVNIRHKDYSRGGRVVLNWEEYQSLRAQGIYPEPVPQLNSQATDEPAPEQQPV